jgi:hypothetical protein
MRKPVQAAPVFPNEPEKPLIPTTPAFAEVIAVQATRMPTKSDVPFMIHPPVAAADIARPVAIVALDVVEIK